MSDETCFGDRVMKSVSMCISSEDKTSPTNLWPSKWNFRNTGIYGSGKPGTPHSKNDITTLKSFKISWPRKRTRLFLPEKGFIENRRSSFETHKLHLRNRKHVPCFYRVIQTRVEVWENEKCCGNTSRRRVFPQLFRVLPNFHECLYNSIETRSTCFLFLLENTTMRKRKTPC